MVVVSTFMAHLWLYAISRKESGWRRCVPTDIRGCGSAPAPLTRNSTVPLTRSHRAKMPHLRHALSSTNYGDWPALLWLLLSSLCILGVWLAAGGWAHRLLRSRPLKKRRQVDQCSDTEPEGVPVHQVTHQGSRRHRNVVKPSGHRTGTHIRPLLSSVDGDHAVIDPSVHPTVPPPANVSGEGADTLLPSPSGSQGSTPTPVTAFSKWIPPKYIKSNLD